MKYKNLLSVAHLVFWVAVKRELLTNVTLLRRWPTSALHVAEFSAPATKVPIGVWRLSARVCVIALITSASSLTRWKTSSPLKASSGLVRVSRAVFLETLSVIWGFSFQFVTNLVQFFAYCRHWKIIVLVIAQLLECAWVCLVWVRLLYPQLSSDNST